MSDPKPSESKLAQGFAAAANPVPGQAIHTGSEGLEQGEISIPVGDDRIPGYFARPSSGDRFPLVLLVQEVFGVHEHIKDVARRLANLGYYAIAPELFYRQGDVSKMHDPKEINAQIVSKVPDAQVLADLDATVSFAEQTGKADLSRLGMTGFCWGGRISWLYATHNPKLKAAVAWYGRLTNERTANHPQHPVDIASSLRAPVLGLYGGADPSIPLAHVEQMRKALETAGKSGESRIEVYDDAPHAFYADYRPGYRKQAADDGWQKMQSWFREHGVV